MAKRFGKCELYYSWSPDGCLNCCKVYHLPYSAKFLSVIDEGGKLIVSYAYDDSSPALESYQFAVDWNYREYGDDFTYLGGVLISRANKVCHIHYRPLPAASPREDDEKTAKITVHGQVLYCHDQSYIIWLPEGAKILSVIERYGEFMVYYECSPEAPDGDSYEFYALRTDEFYDLEGFTFLGTVPTLGGKEVYHVYYRKAITIVET